MSVPVMAGKRVLFIANSLDNAYTFRQVLSEFGADIAVGSTQQIKKLLTSEGSTDLIVFEARGSAWSFLDQVGASAESNRCPLLVIVDSKDISRLGLPSQVSSDFVVNGAGLEECSARVRRLLGEGMADTSENVLRVDSMTINLATYQVRVAGEPVDLTYLEYALLAFLVQHPNRTFTRDMLLQNVWGFDYYGGSRTVDVHVRRIRAKLGPALAQYLETVRGVGYLWNSH